MIVYKVMFKINKSILCISLLIIFMTGCSNFRKQPVELSKRRNIKDNFEYELKFFCDKVEYVYKNKKLKEKPYVLIDYFHIKDSIFHKNDIIEKYSFDIITDYNQTDFPPSLYKFNKNGFTIIFRNRSNLEECRDCKDMPAQSHGSAYWDLERKYLYYLNDTLKWSFDYVGSSSDKHDLLWWIDNPDSLSDEPIMINEEKNLRL